MGSRQPLSTETPRNKTQGDSLSQAKGLSTIPELWCCLTAQNLVVAAVTVVDATVVGRQIILLEPRVSRTAGRAPL